MKFTDFLKDKIAVILYNFSFLLFTVFVILLTPQNDAVTSSLIYIVFINLILFTIYILISYFRTLKVVAFLKEDINLHNIGSVSTIKPNNEENIYFKVIKAYQHDYENLVNANEDKLEENKDIMSMWVHDVKLPISIIKLIIEKNEGSDCYSILSNIDDEIMRIENSVERVLYLSRVENFHKDFLVQSVYIQKTIREVIRKYSRYFIENKIKLNIDNIDFDVLSDKKWLFFIFDQIIGNSLKYTDQEGSINIYGEDSSDTIKIHISDTGTGIKSEDLPNIFNKGFTGNNGRKFAKSTGLGLYLTKELCDKLEHKITVNSTYGNGTTFTLTLTKTQ